ncbi:hypothetical protein [Pseudoalteromonas sp. MMG005]|uniref:hypothetical protein n=1 Tax=Pseudoalteromonas sp. MMG005 TaxID=2822682 RepID=UPI001B3A3BDD|nr:hypothetical protein [Pseudoalteromonas sp. MMG005]MBQ4846579.1 hypothetical protein [Pseudoalteromonas sp. MMG005]
MQKISLLKTLSAMNFLIKGNGPRTEKLAGDQNTNKLNQESCTLVFAGTAVKPTRPAVATHAPIIPIDILQG